MNFRIFIRICLIVQIIAVYFSNNTLFCVESVRHISPDVNYGWLLRLLHANGTRLFFICLYLHVERWLQFNPFYFSKHMNNRCVNYNCCYSRSFLGYMVPWGQISFWGSHWYYQFIFNYSLHRGRVSSLNVCGGGLQLKPLHWLGFFSSFYHPFVVCSHRYNPFVIFYIPLVGVALSVSIVISIKPPFTIFYY